MMSAAALQWGLLAGYAALLACAAVAGYRIPWLRPLAFMVGLLATTHALYYALFLVWPEVLDGQRTMLFSIAIRYQVLFSAALGLALAVQRSRWR